MADRSPASPFPDPLPRVLLVGADEPASAALAAALAPHGIQVVGTAASVEAAVDAVDRHHATVVVAELEPGLVTALAFTTDPIVPVIFHTSAYTPVSHQWLVETCGAFAATSRRHTPIAELATIIGDAHAEYRRAVHASGSSGPDAGAGGRTIPAVPSPLGDGGARPAPADQPATGQAARPLQSPMHGAGGAQAGAGAGSSSGSSSRPDPDGGDDDQA